MCATSPCSPDADYSTSASSTPAGSPSCSASETTTAAAYLPGTGPECLSSETSVKLLPTPRATRGGSQTETLYALGAERSDEARTQGEVLLPTPCAQEPGGSRGHRLDGTKYGPTSGVTLTDAARSISSSAGSPASPSATPVSVKLKLTIGGSGPRWQESFAHYDPDSCSWRTSRASLLPDSEKSSLTWPARGTTRNGSAYELPTWGHLTDASDCSSSPLLPTPCAQEPGGSADRYLERKNRADGGSRTAENGNLSLTHTLRLLPTPTTDDANNVTRASGEYQSLARTAPALSGATTSPPSPAGKQRSDDPPQPQPTIGDD